MNNSQKIRLIKEELLRRHIENAAANQKQIKKMSTYELEKMLKGLKQGTSALPVEDTTK